MTPKPEEAQFRAMAQAFLDAVKARDWNSFERYFNRDLAFCAVLPGAKVYKDVPSFLESQLTWFRGTTGSFDFLIERAEVSGDLGAAFARVEYKDVDPQNKPFAFEIFISFLFRRINDQWFLIHDQNTVLRETR